MDASQKPKTGPYDRMDKGIQGLGQIIEGARLIRFAANSGGAVTGTDLHLLAEEVLQKVTSVDFSPFSKHRLDPEHDSKSSKGHSLCFEIPLRFELIVQGEVSHSSQLRHKPHPSPCGSNH